MAEESLTQPAGSFLQPDLTPARRTKGCHIGRSYTYLCQVGSTFTYSHTPFGKVVWHR